MILSALSRGGKPLRAILWLVSPFGTGVSVFCTVAAPHPGTLLPQQKSPSML
jgi:hypothetical protein